MDQNVRVTVWNEYRHERRRPELAAIYPKGIHGAIAEGIQAFGGITTRTATLEEPEHGLSEAVLDETDVLIWWAHGAHQEVLDSIVDRVQQRVLAGMGLIVLHSGHFSKILRKLLGTNCSLTWREAGEKERLWNIAPDHQITEGIGSYIEIPHSEMYGERFDIPEPDRLIFISWYQGGEVFRSGCTWQRGNGKIFYFSPGHQSHPIYHDKQILRVIANAARWARPRVISGTDKCQHSGTPPEPLNQEARD